MSHITAKKGYESLVVRLNKYPQGAPPSENLYKILKMLFSEEEARLVAQLPIRPFEIATAAKRWSMSHAEASRVLEGLAKRAVLIDVYKEGKVFYVLPPPMDGFFEFSMMRTRGDIDQEMLAKLYYEYLNVEEDFVKELFCDSQNSFIRTFVNESVLTTDDAVTILDFERASHYIETSEHMGISMCYCRHKMEHVGKACEALLAQKRFGNLQPIETTAYIANISDSCVDCGRCISACPVELIQKNEHVEILEDLCLGCGVCVRATKCKSLTLKKRGTRILTPENSVHRAVLLAIDKGKLQNLIFDNDALYSHRAMAAILSAILKLSPVKRAMASDQMRSHYLVRLIEILGYK